MIHSQPSPSNALPLAPAAVPLAGTSPVFARGDHVHPAPTVASFTSADQVAASAAVYTLAHGLGRKPIIVTVWAKCITPQNNWLAGDEVQLSTGGNDYGNVGTGVRVHVADAVNVVVGLATGNFVFMNKTTNVAASMTYANWAIIVKAI